MKRPLLFLSLLLSFLAATAQERTPFRELARRLEAGGSYRFFWDDPALDTLTVTGQGTTLEERLSSALSATRYRYTVQGNWVFITQDVPLWERQTTNDKRQGSTPHSLLPTPY